MGMSSHFRLDPSEFYLMYDSKCWYLLVKVTVTAINGNFDGHKHVNENDNTKCKKEYDLQN